MIKPGGVACPTILRLSTGVHKVQYASPSSLHLGKGGTTYRGHRRQSVLTNRRQGRLGTRHDFKYMKALHLFGLAVVLLMATACQSPSTGHSDDRPFNIQSRNFESPRQ